MKNQIKMITADLDLFRSKLQLWLLHLRSPPCEDSAKVTATSVASSCLKLRSPRALEKMKQGNHQSNKTVLIVQSYWLTLSSIILLLVFTVNLSVDAWVTGYIEKSAAPASALHIVFATSTASSMSSGPKLSNCDSNLWLKLLWPLLTTSLRLAAAWP